MQVHVLQHMPFEGLGSIEAWLLQQNADVQYTRFYESSALPDTGAIDSLIVMGGPMSVNDQANYPWLKQEKRFIAEVIRRGLPVLGVCLGAQLIASAMGAPVYASEEKEIGWFSIERVEGDADVFQFPRQLTVFHWHGETFDLPSGAVRLAKSRGCKNQAFQIGKNVIGLQFHLEMTPSIAGMIVSHFRHELVNGAYIQNEQSMRAMPESAYLEINKWMDDVLCYVTRP